MRRRPLPDDRRLPRDAHNALAKSQEGFDIPSTFRLRASASTPVKQAVYVMAGEVFVG